MWYHGFFFSFFFLFLGNKKKNLDESFLLFSADSCAFSTRGTRGHAFSRVRELVNAGVLISLFFNFFEEEEEEEERLFLPRREVTRRLRS